VFWTGGTHGYGHIALSDGAGHVWTTDLPTARHVGLIPVGDVLKDWPNHTFVGWADWLEGEPLPLT
jgi:hypothetical protein